MVLPLRAGNARNLLVTIAMAKEIRKKNGIVTVTAASVKGNERRTESLIVKEPKTMIEGRGVPAITDMMTMRQSEGAREIMVARERKTLTGRRTEMVTGLQSIIGTAREMIGKGIVKAEETERGNRRGAIMVLVIGMRPL